MSPSYPPDAPLRIEGPLDTVEALLGMGYGPGTTGETIKVGDQRWVVERTRLSAGFNQGITLMVDLLRVTTVDDPEEPTPAGECHCASCEGGFTG